MSKNHRPVLGELGKLTLLLFLLGAREELHAPTRGSNVLLSLLELVRQVLDLVRSVVAVLKAMGEQTEPSRQKKCDTKRLEEDESVLTQYLFQSKLKRVLSSEDLKISTSSL